MAKAKPSEKPKKKSIWKKDHSKSILRWIVDIGVVLILAFITAFLFEGSITVQESSMDPTIQAGDVVLINRISYRLGSVRRGDLIAYRNRDVEDSVYHIKRVIGLPGETIQIKDGLIMINGETYMEQRELPNIIDAGIAVEPVKLRNDEYFVLGDNRNNSEDSRFADVGNIKRSYISGKVWFLRKPSSRRGFL
ncbi:MAG: signal peptidase I [Lachnospiraceae bacterium]|nr:signal peptidase I [Lachnospiraceae bacterium]